MLWVGFPVNMAIFELQVSFHTPMRRFVRTFFLMSYSVKKSTSPL